jgi:hypothetical protein
LTFNTTSLSSNTEALPAKLITRKPLRLQAEQKRHLYVTQEIADLLDGKTQRGLFPTVASETLIGRFCAGYLITVSRKRNDKRPDLEQLEGLDEVWALCPRIPKPGWRLLGRFLSKGRLVLLRAWDKHKLASRYSEAGAEVINDWSQILPDHRPLRGASVEDYVGELYRDVD